MKKTLVLLLSALLAVGLLACTPGGKKSYLRVKCPSCGYEFDAPSK